MQSDFESSGTQSICANLRAQLLVAIPIGGLSALAAGLWLKYGEQIYLSSLIATIAGCF